MRFKSEDNFQKKCRICGRFGRRFADIFTTQMSELKSNRKLPQLIYRCLQLQVKEDDDLPKKICDDCKKKLTSWQEFFNKCEQTQKRFVQYLENQQKSLSSDILVSQSIGQILFKTSDRTEASVSEQLNEIVVPTTNINTTDSGKLQVQNKTDEDNINENLQLMVKKEKNKCKKGNTCQNNVEEIKPSLQIAEVGKDEKDLVQNVQTPESNAESCIKKLKTSKSSLKVKKRATVHQCHICEKTFPSESKLKSHIAAHLNYPEYQCDKCNKKFRSKFSLRSHLETHSENRNYCCHLCGSLFHTASGLCNHVRLHSEETKRFTCPLCGKQFRQAGHLEQHQRTHTGERPHQCPECVQKFTTRCQLSRHIQGVHRCAKKHKCVTCGKEFLYGTNFKAHLLRHAGQRNNKCNECGKTFVTSNALFRHRRSHTGDKPFECNICGKKFADCSNRKRHMLRHWQQPVIPKGRKSGPRPKIARIIASTEQSDSGKQKGTESEDTNKISNQLVQIIPQEDINNDVVQINQQSRDNTSSQNVPLSREIIQLCNSSNIEFSNLTNVYTSNVAHESSNIYVNLSDSTSQIIQLPVENTNILIQPIASDVTQLVQIPNKEKQAQLIEYDDKGQDTLKTHTSWCVIQTNNEQSEVPTEEASEHNMLKNDIELSKPKTYENLRTFLESSEVAETISGGKTEIEDGENVEFVTLIAGDENGNNVSSGIQEIIVLPRETRISDLNLSTAQISVQNSDINKEKDANDQVTLLTEALLTPQQGKADNLYSLSKKEVFNDCNQELQITSSNCDNLIEVFFSNKNENISHKSKNESIDPSNLVEVLLDPNDSIVSKHQESLLTSRTRQTLLISSESFTDDDAIIRMLNGQRTTLLSTLRNDNADFDLSGSQIAEVAQLIEEADRKVSDDVESHDEFVINDAVMNSHVGKKSEIDLIDSTDYEQETSLTTTITLNNADMKKNLSVDELENGMKADCQNSAISAATSLDDMEMFELCTDEDLTKLTPISHLYQVYQTGKSIENV